jgi:hypothetical protein
MPGSEQFNHVTTTKDKENISMAGIGAILAGAGFLILCVATGIYLLARTGRDSMPRKD